MIRSVLALVVVASVGITAAFAEDIIADRKALMKRSGDQAKLGATMVRGEVPFDLAKAKTIFETYVDKASKLPNLFPANSKTGGETHAAPAIWEKPDEFKALIAKFGVDAKAALDSTKDADSFKAAFVTVGKDCGACHETFRLKM
jgi:cytochrome c556